MSFINKVFNAFIDRPAVKKPKTYGSSTAIEKRAYKEAHEQGNLEYFGKRSKEWYPKKINTKILNQSIYRVKLNKNPRNP